MIQKRGRDIPAELIAATYATLARLLPGAPNRFGPGARLLLDLGADGSLHLVARSDWRVREAVEEDEIAHGTWRFEDSHVHLAVEDAYGFRVMPDERSRCRLAWREAALWLDFGRAEGHDWSLRWERVPEDEAPVVGGAPPLPDAGMR
jgi:hypothetical protein